MFKEGKKKIHFEVSLDNEREFPKNSFEQLKELGLLDPVDRGAILNIGKNPIKVSTVLQTLKEVGNIDLSVGRLLEGHYNALILICTYGTESQIRSMLATLDKGVIYGVWNTERGYEGLEAEPYGNDSYILKGAKVFASGAKHIQPIVTAKIDGKVVMISIPMEIMHSLSIDWSLWSPMGMKSSVSARIDFDGVVITKSDIIGSTEDYFKEPHFHGGAVRFAAVQLGGIEKVAYLGKLFLQKHNRTTDPFQISRMAEIALLLETGNLWLEKAIDVMESGTTYSVEYKVHFADMTRTLIADVCHKTLALVEKSVGLQALMISNELERWHRDLSTYLKQPGPDATLTRIGTHYLSNSN